MRKRKFLCYCIYLIILAFYSSCFFSITSTFAIINSYRKIHLNTTLVEINIVENEYDKEIFEEAEKVVENFIKPYSEYISPKNIIFCEILTEDIYGFQLNEDIYIDNTRKKEEIFSTIIHELLHLQNPIGFDINLEDEITVGHNLTEACIEKITCDLTGQEETQRVELLKSYLSEEACNIMQEAFCKKNQNIFNQYIDDNQMHDVFFEDKNYRVSTSNYFKIAFDKWMIIDEKDKQIIFNKLKAEE